MLFYFHLLHYIFLSHYRYEQVPCQEEQKYHIKYEDGLHSTLANLNKKYLQKINEQFLFLTDKIFD